MQESSCDPMLERKNLRTWRSTAGVFCAPAESYAIMMIAIDDKELEKLKQQASQLQEENASLRKQIDLLMEQIRLARHQRFAPSSERSSPLQKALGRDV